MDEPIRYEIDLHARRQHLVEVTITVPADLAAGARLVLPTWTPGSYVIRDYVHHVQRILATSGGDTIPLTAEGRTAWRLPDDLTGPATVSLELYANDLTVRTNHVDEHHALLVAPATLPYVEGAEGRRHIVTIPPPGDEEVFSLLPAGDDPDSYVAEDVLHLMDAAFEVGDHPHATSSVKGVPHTVVWVGPEPARDPEALTEDLTAVAEQAVALFDGDLPVASYTALAIASTDGSGGLEHRDGAVLQIPLRALMSDDGHARVQSLLAHEYLHLWNVKRLVPAALVTPDLVRPTHTPSLWVAEGWTSYYDHLLPLRAGLWTLDRFLSGQADRIRGSLTTPAVELQSVREASWQAWVKHYVRDENTPNAGVNYYSHGALVAWCLDLLIRRETDGQGGLDDALRSLWHRFGHTDEGYEEADVERACAEAAGQDLGWFFDDYVERAAMPPIEELVEVVGLRLVSDEDGRTTPWLGVNLQEEDGEVTLSSVLRGGPAWHAGLTGGDRLLAVDGLEVREGELGAALRLHEPGEVVPVTVFRGRRLVTAEVTLDDPRPPHRLTAVEEPTTAQKSAFHAWTGRDLDEV